jgi:transcriptional regulator with XRE-family HTH domain
VRANRLKPVSPDPQASDEMIRVGRNLRRLRTRRGHSQQFIGEYLGIHQSAVSRVEKAEQELSNRQLVQLSELYAYSVDTLLRTEVCL